MAILHLQLMSSRIYKSNFLGLFEVEIKNSDDTLVTLSVLELLYKQLDDVAVQGAQLLLSSSLPAARHVVDAAFDRQRCASTKLTRAYTSGPGLIYWSQWKH